LPEISRRALLAACRETIWQTEANRAKFTGKRIDEFAPHVERAGQLVDSHGEWRGVEQICGRGK
jgi:hypothetical protein